MKKIIAMLMLLAVITANVYAEENPYYNWEDEHGEAEDDNNRV